MTVKYVKPIYLGPDFETPIRKSNENKLAEAVIKRLNRSSGGYTFGKYLRNIVSNKPFTGLDMCVSPLKLPQVLSDIGRHYKYSLVSQGDDPIKEATFHKYKIWNEKTGTSIEATFWSGKHGWEQIVRDSDVNSLIRNSENFVRSSVKQSKSKDEIIKQIKSNKYEMYVNEDSIKNELNSWSKTKKNVRTSGKGKKMDMSNFLDMSKKDATDAAYRVAGNQMTKGVKTGIIALMKDKGVEGGKVEAIRELLETEVGNAAVATILGQLLTHIPQLQDDQRVQKLAEEFRVQGMATAGNLVLDTMFQYFLPVVKDAMADLPQLEEKVRVEADATASKEEIEEEEEETLKQANA